MGDEILVRHAVEEDTGRIIELLKASLGEGTIPREPGYWNWKHRTNPFGASPVLLAECKGQLVGLRAFMRWSWLRNGVETQAVRAVDTATHPRWQGRGIFTRLTLGLLEAVKAEGVSFVFNTPNHRSRPGYLKMGWSSVGRAPMLVRPRRPDRIMRSVAAHRKGSESPEIEGSTLGPTFDVATQLQRPELDRLLDTRSRDPRLSTRLSRAYLQWRYGDVPGFDYYAAGSWQSGEEALVVFRVRSRKGLAELRLCEVLVAPNRAARRRVAGLVRNVVRATRPDYAVAMAATGTIARRGLTGAGFLPAPRTGPILTVRTLDDSAGHAGLFHWSGWDVSIGDLELF